MQVDENGRPMCHMCEKTFKDRRGLCGHLWAVHRIKASECAEYTNGEEKVILGNYSKDIFFLVEDIREIDEVLKRAKEENSGSFFGLGLIPTKSQVDRDFVEALELLRAIKMQEAKVFIEEMTKIKKFAKEKVNGQGIEAYSPDIVARRNKTARLYLKRHKSALDSLRAQSVQGHLDQGSSYDEMRDSFRGNR